MGWDPAMEMQAGLRLWWHLPSYVDRIQDSYCLVPSQAVRWHVSLAVEAAVIVLGLVAARSCLVLRLQVVDSVQARSGTLINFG